MTKGMGTLTIATRLQNTVLCFYELCALPSYSTQPPPHTHTHTPAAANINTIASAWQR